MSASIRRYWAMFPASIAGPAFMAGGVIWAIAAILGFISTSGLVGPPDKAPSQELTIGLENLYWFVMLIADLALLAGLAAIYKRWAPVLDSLGRLGLLLAAIGLVMRTIEEAVIALYTLVALVLTGSSAYSVPGIEHSIVQLLSSANQVTLFALWGGMALLGIYVMRAGVKLLPGWAGGLLLTIGLWGFLLHFLYASQIYYHNLIPAIVPAGKSQETILSVGAGLSLLLSLPGIVLWVLLGMTLLSEQLVSPVQTELIASSTGVTKFVSNARPYRPRWRR